MAKKSKSSDEKRSPIRQSRTSKRILIKKDGKIPDEALHGIVVAFIGKKAYIKPDNEEFIHSKLIACTLAGTIITKNELSSVLAVGDGVHFLKENVIDKESGLYHGSIIAVDERKTLIARKTPGKGISENIIASDIDHLLIVLAAYDPIYNKRLIDRYLVSAEAGGVKPAICINKIDLVEDISFFEEDLEVYKKLGIPIFFISARENQGIDDIREFLSGKRTLLSGVSGSGKSTLVNSLIGEQVQAVADISERTLKGKHVTTFVKMFELEEGTRIIDSPGIREFGIIGIEKHDISLYFHDFDDFFPHCKYSPCTHTHEPGCAVNQAVDDELIDIERYLSYVNIYESINKTKY